MVAFLRLRLETTPEPMARAGVRISAILDVMATGWTSRWAQRRHKMNWQNGPDRPTRLAEKRFMNWDELRQDLVYAFRTLRRSPGYTAVVLLTLGVGIALNTLVFSVMNPFLFRPLPYSAPEELVHLGGLDPLSGWDGGRFSSPQIADLQDQSRAFQGLAGYFYGSVNVTGDVAAEQVTSSWVTGNLFPLLGVTPSFGRTLGPQDDEPGAPPVVILGQGIWMRRFGGDPGIVSKDIRLDGVLHTVVGVLPTEFNFPFNAVEMWLPMRAQPTEEARSDMGTMVVGRLGDGWTSGTASEEINRVHGQLAALHPDSDGQYQAIVLKPLREALNFASDIIGPAFLILLVGMGLVLVIACVNVTSLNLARLGSRTREVGLRQALGAGRPRLVRQFLVEAVVLALGGGILGVGLAYLGTNLLKGLVPPDLYRVGEVSLDGRVLAFSGLVALATPLFFALAPAWTVTRKAITQLLQEGSRGSGTGRRALRGRRILVVAEVTMAVALVSSTGLMVRSLVNAMSTDVGFGADRILTAELEPDRGSTEDVQALNLRFQALVQGVQRISGVEGVGTASHLPLNHESFPIRYTTPDGQGIPIADRSSAFTSRVGPDYMATMGIPLLSGRVFRPEDGEPGANGVLVTRSLAEQLWPGGSAVGQTMIYGDEEEPTVASILGVVGDVRWDGLTGTPRPHIFRPLVGTASRRRFLVISASPGTTAEFLLEPVRQALYALDPDLPAVLRPMTDIVKESAGLWAISSLFLGGFGLVALALAALGIYGIVAYSVSQRTREMGLRLALGAEPSRLLRGVVTEALRLTSLGLVLGALASVGAGILLSNVLFGVGVVDPVTLGSTAGAFLAVAGVSAFLPARRAASVDVLEAIREE
jgi:putative ABC transport system permease protein